MIPNASEYFSRSYCSNDNKQKTLILDITMKALT